MSKYTDEMFSRLFEGQHPKSDFDHPIISKDMLESILTEAMEAQREACIEDLEIEWDIYSGMINCIRNARVEGDD